jgi:hypothetical protein
MFKIWNTTPQNCLKKDSNKTESRIIVLIYFLPLSTKKDPIKNKFLSMMKNKTKLLPVLYRCSSAINSYPKKKRFKRPKLILKIHFIMALQVILLMVSGSLFVAAVANKSWAQQEK